MDFSYKAVHARGNIVPRSVEQQLQKNKEIVRLVDIGVIEEDYSSEWSSPSFAFPKKNGTIRVVTDFIKLNLFLKRHAFPILKIGDMIRLLEISFTFKPISDKDIH
jgi:hypothetical protein